MKQKIIISIFLTTLSGIIVAVDSSSFYHSYTFDKKTNTYTPTILTIVSFPFDDHRRLCTPAGSIKFSEEQLLLSYEDPIEKKSFQTLLSDDDIGSHPSFVARCTSATNESGQTSRSYYYCGQQFLNKHVEDSGTLKDTETLANGKSPECTKFFVLAPDKSNTSFYKNQRFAYLFNNQDLAKTVALQKVINSLRENQTVNTLISLFEWSNNLNNNDLRKESALVVVNDYSCNDDLTWKAAHNLGNYYSTQNIRDKKAKYWLKEACQEEEGVKEALLDLGKWYEAQGKNEKARKKYEIALKCNVVGAQKALDALKGN